MIDERVALVTGGSRGIGRAICVALAEAGFRVYINYTANKGAADSVVSECLEYGKGGASALQFDVGSKEEVEKAINTIKEESGRLDVNVNVREQLAGVPSEGESGARDSVHGQNGCAGTRDGIT